MTPEAQRIAIAEACGWYEIHYYGTENNGPESDINPLRLVGKRSKRGVGSWAVICSVPDYPTDLNAMHEAEKVLSRDGGYHQEGGFGLYKTALEEVCDEQHPIDATAAQRAEAFLRTLGKWEDDK